MKRTLEQRLLTLANDLRESCNDTVRARLFAETEDDLRTIAKETAGRVLTRPKLTDYKGENFSCRLASITIEAFEHHGGGQTDEEAIVKLQGQIDATEAPSSVAPSPAIPEPGDTVRNTYTGQTGLVIWVGNRVTHWKPDGLNAATRSFTSGLEVVKKAPSPSTPKQTWPSDPRVVNAGSWHRMSADEQERYVQQHNLTIGCTTDIGGEIRYGWGIVDDNGFWHFPCGWHTPDKPKGG